MFNVTFNNISVISWRELVVLYVATINNSTSTTSTKDYVRGCTISTKYWPPSTSWRLCQRLFYFYQILTTSNKLKIMWEIVLSLSNTDHLLQVEEYVRGCTTSSKYCPPPISWRLCQRLYRTT